MQQSARRDAALKARHDDYLAFIKKSYYSPGPLKKPMFEYPWVGNACIPPRERGMCTGIQNSVLTQRQKVEQMWLSALEDSKAMRPRVNSVPLAH